MARTVNPADSHRLRAAAEILRSEPDLGPDDFRHAIAGWLANTADVTQRIERLNVRTATLPQVVTIVEVIENARTDT